MQRSPNAIAYASQAEGFIALTFKPSVVEVEKVLSFTDEIFKNSFGQFKRLKHESRRTAKKTQILFKKIDAIIKKRSVQT